MTEPEQEPDAGLGKAYRALQEKGSEACPQPETLAALAAGELAGEQRQRTANHVVRCRSCTESTQILIQTHAEAGGGSRARGGLLARTAGLAAAAVVAIVAARLLLAPRPEPSAERGAARNLQVVPADGASLSSPPEQFSWQAESDAESYRVKLFDDTGEPVWQSDAAKETRAAFPPADRVRLSKGKAYFWNVEVEGRLEKRRLGPFRFRLSPG